MANPIIPVYPFDPTAQAATNKITGEQQVITAVNFKDYHMVVPRYAPFHGDTVRVRRRNLQGTITTLTLGIDYYLGHHFYSASFNSAKPWYGSIYLLDRSLDGTILIDYQTVGGIWTIDLPTITQILADRLNNPLITTWEEVVDLPEKFPPIDHDWEIMDAVGMGDLVLSLASIEDALRDTGSGAINSHLIDFENPHRVTKAQVGLGSVQNYGIATVAEANAGTSTNKYMTPALVRGAIATQVGNAFALHAADQSNPHMVTAAQVGAYTKQEVDSAIQNIINTGLTANDTTHFNGLTAAEFKAWVLEGTAANSILFNGYTYQQVYDQIRTDIPASNIVGVYTKAEVDAFLSQKLGKTEKAADSAKFDGKTYQQAYDDFRSNIPVGNIVGAYSKIEVDNLLGQKLGATETAADSAKFADMNKDVYKAWVLEGKVADTGKWDGQTKQEFITQLTQMFGGGADQETVTRLVYPAATTTGTSSWALIGEVTRGQAGEYNGQMNLMVAGAGTVSNPKEILGTVTVSTVPGTTPSYSVTGKVISGEIGPNVRIGIVTKTRTTGGVSIPYAEVWLQTGKDPLDLAAVMVSPGNGSFPQEGKRVDTEPSGITYTTFEIVGGGVSAEIFTGTLAAGASTTVPIGYESIATVKVASAATGPFYDGVAVLSVSQDQTQTIIKNNNSTSLYYRATFIA